MCSFKTECILHPHCLTLRRQEKKIKIKIMFSSVCPAPEATDWSAARRCVKSSVCMCKTENAGVLRFAQLFIQNQKILH